MVVAWSYPSNPVRGLQKCRAEWVELVGRLVVREGFRVGLAWTLLNRIYSVAMVQRYGPPVH